MKKDHNLFNKWCDIDESLFNILIIMGIIPEETDFNKKDYYYLTKNKVGDFAYFTLNHLVEIGYLKKNEDLFFKKNEDFEIEEAVLEDKTIIELKKENIIAKLKK